MPRNRKAASWPVFRFEGNQSDESSCCYAATKKVVMVAVDATETWDGRAMEWTLQHISLQEGDSVVLVGVIHSIINPMGYKTQANRSFNGTNDRVLEHVITSKASEYRALVCKFSNLCIEKKVHIDVHIRPGWPLKVVVVMQAQAINATIVVLDRRLKKDTQFYLSHLLRSASAPGCNDRCEKIIIMMHGRRRGDAQQLEYCHDTPQKSRHSLQRFASMREVFPHKSKDLDSRSLLMADHLSEKDGDAEVQKGRESVRADKLSEKFWSCSLSRSFSKHRQARESCPSFDTLPWSELLVGGPHRWRPCSM